MSYAPPDSRYADLVKPVIVDSCRLPWTPSPLPGVERRLLDRDDGGETARATSIVRYAPGCAFSPHVHDKGEEYLVLEGVFSDESGDFAKDTYVRNPPGSRHRPFTRDGCTIFVKLRQMPDSERTPRVVWLPEASASATAIAGLERIVLYESHDGERVAIEEFAAGAIWNEREATGGEEILVLGGTLDYGERPCGPGTWLRMPIEKPMSSSSGCRIWVKRGHLSATQQLRPADPVA
jgi:anti-sigma factor ChrR (cupin superfamily)